MPDESRKTRNKTEPKLPPEDKPVSQAIAERGTKKKRECPVTREQFKEEAKNVTVVVNGVPMIATVKEFSSGSFGWYLTGKTVIDVDGEQCSVQIGMNLTVIGSKDLPV